MKSILLYDCGTWALTLTEKERLHAYQRIQLKKILNIRYPGKKNRFIESAKKIHCHYKSIGSLESFGLFCLSVCLSLSLSLSLSLLSLSLSIPLLFFYRFIPSFCLFSLIISVPLPLSFSLFFCISSASLSLPQSLFIFFCPPLSTSTKY